MDNGQLIEEIAKRIYEFVRNDECTQLFWDVNLNKDIKSKFHLKARKILSIIKPRFDAIKDNATELDMVLGTDGYISDGIRMNLATIIDLCKLDPAPEPQEIKPGQVWKLNSTGKKFTISSSKVSNQTRVIFWHDNFGIGYWEFDRQIRKDCTLVTEFKERESNKEIEKIIQDLKTDMHHYTDRIVRLLNKDD